MVFIGCKKSEDGNGTIDFEELCILEIKMSGARPRADLIVSWPLDEMLECGCGEHLLAPLGKLWKKSEDWDELKGDKEQQLLLLFMPPCCLHLNISSL